MSMGKTRPFLRRNGKLFQNQLVEGFILTYLSAEMEESPQNDNNKNQRRQNDPGLLLVLAVKQGKNNTFSRVFLTAVSW